MSVVYLEDFTLGETFEGGPVSVTEDDIITFASQFDPQPMHTDPEAAQQGPFGQLVGSGWHTAGLTMRMMVKSGRFGDTPLLGLGVDKVRLLAPMCPDDTLHVQAVVTEIRPSRSKPEQGIMRVELKTFNQNKVVVLEQEWAMLMPRRDSTPTDLD